MPQYLTPGVYVEEVSTGARPIEAVGTSTAGFVGVAPDARAHLNEALPVNNWSEFLRLFAKEESRSTALSHAVFGFFQNGGSRCYVANVGANGSVMGSGKGRGGLSLLEAIEDISIVAIPGFTDAGSYEAALAHCESMGNRVAILDAKEKVDDITALTRIATPEGKEENPGARARQSDGGFGAFYFPWLKVRDPLDPTAVVTIPPSGHLAGVYARIDSQRGVHKAPANEAIRGALDLTYRCTNGEQGELNSNGVNVIRFFQREGVRIWGARTLAPAASEWRYINVRRLFNMVEESIARSTRWVVFEPNDASLWKSIVRDVGAFLLGLWRQGALMGATPEQAFFVKCDAETNPKEVIDAGRVVIEIGIAPLKPAEFVIFRIGQYAAGTDVG